ncbi:TIM barrel protein [Micromonospora sp. WMMD1120]|uniref:hydroxypyruvate isomerase family protein n=1 Tax=Micromonospora sp. WMMD1120 TaxID=3016106 RepID=UPI0024168980|nr:TIM barrel protein [Micromonospora sp. WMMD1120]MDG4807190.1 TIM barrel protein [Micromonospora sp. WMMD1120]
MHLSLNVSISHIGLTLVERLRSAASAGFDVVEMWWPFEQPDPPREELASLASEIRSAGLKLALLNLDGGDLGSGERGILSHPHAAERFRANLQSALWLAEETGCRVLNALYGNRLPGLDQEVAGALAVRHLTAASQAASDIGAEIVVEALNSGDCPAYPLNTPQAVVELIEEVRSAGAVEVGYLCDVYHLARMGIEPAVAVRDFGAYVGHVQVADFPGRGIPGSGTIRFPELFAALRATGYAGYVGVECHGADKIKPRDVIRLMAGGAAGG